MARLPGVKALFVGKQKTVVFEQLAAHVRHSPWVSFPQVFPRCEAVVHHGGIGTLAHAIKAGIPQFVVPYAHDQPDHALRVERLGLGTSLYPEEYRSARAAGMLKQLIAATDMRQRCRDYGSKIDSEAALGRACSLLESFGRA